MTYLAPLKLAVVDVEGTMRLHYWPKNDLMKGPKLPAERLALLAPSAANANRGGERIIATALNNRNGTVLEGKLPSCKPGAIIFKGGASPPVDYEVAVDAALVFSISTVAANGTRTLLDRFDRSIPVPPTTGSDAAGGDAGGCTFKLLLRGSMVELYINDVLTLPFALPSTITPGGYAQDGGWAEGVRAPSVTVGLSGAWTDAKLEGWTMGLAALFPQV